MNGCSSKTNNGEGSAPTAAKTLTIAISTGPGQSKIVPGLADKWDVSADGKVYKFTLHPGVKFHNAEVLTADDVVYTFDRMLRRPRL